MASDPADQMINTRCDTGADCESPLWSISRLSSVQQPLPVPRICNALWLGSWEAPLPACQLSCHTRSTVSSQDVSGSCTPHSSCVGQGCAATHCAWVVGGHPNWLPGVNCPGLVPVFWVPVTQQVTGSRWLGQTPSLAGWLVVDPPLRTPAPHTTRQPSCGSGQAANAVAEATGQPQPVGRYGGSEQAPTRLAMRLQARPHRQAVLQWLCRAGVGFQ